MNKKLDIVALCGSLRAASHNRMLMNLAIECAPSAMAVEVLDWRDVPVFDGDVFVKGLPAPVAALKARIARADGVLIVTPEYNFSVPGGLKNVLDWLSRGDDQPWPMKPVAIASASGGPLGGARMQYDLRKVLLYLNALVLAKPEVFCGMAQTKFDAAGKCTDDVTRKFATDLMAAFERWVGGVAKMKA
ncbi:MAG TPA: NADPH-dependent FMN reductase [Burkholderiaceae bacterium]|jgi:chromate reductase|nr:NADPH-dependent FMN reductase [Burkholderiaceae bacterium]